MSKNECPFFSSLGGSCCNQQKDLSAVVVPFFVGFGREMTLSAVVNYLVSMEALWYPTFETREFGYLKRK